MQEKVLAFEQLPELIQNLAVRAESLEKTVREKHQPLPLEGELMNVEDICKLLGKSRSAIYRSVREQAMPFISGRAIDCISTEQPSRNGSTRNKMWKLSFESKSLRNE